MVSVNCPICSSKIDEPFLKERQITIWDKSELCIELAKQTVGVAL